MTISDDEKEEMLLAATSVGQAIAAVSPGWPLNKRETMAAFILMGLTSRLQPVSATSAENRQRVIDLGIDLADAALAELGKDLVK